MGTLRVLVVDDEPGFLATVAASLELEGLEVETAASGYAALALLRTGSYDAVLTDVQMPAMSGVDLLRETRRIAPKLPVTVMTANPANPAAADAVSEGAFELVVKPFRIEDMVATLRRSVASRPA